MTLTCGDVTVECPWDLTGEPVGELAGSVRVGDGPAVAVVFVTKRQYTRRIADALRAIQSSNPPVLPAAAPPVLPVFVPEVTPAAIEALIRKGGFEALRTSAQPPGSS